MRPRFVLFGDSITQQSFAPGGWGAALANLYARKADVVLRGFSGYNTRWALFLLDKLFPSGSQDPPLLVTIFFGANDAALLGRKSASQHVPLAEYKSNILKMISRIKGISEKTCVVLITPPPVHEEALQLFAWQQWGARKEDLPSRTNEVTGTYAKACIESAKEAGVPVIDLWSSMQEESGWQTKYLSDGLHLSQGGNAFLFQKLSKLLDNNGLSFDAMKWDFPEHFKVNADDPAETFTTFSSHTATNALE